MNMDSKLNIDAIGSSARSLWSIERIRCYRALLLCRTDRASRSGRASHLATRTKCLSLLLRLQRYEDALKDMQATIADLKAQGQQHSHSLRNVGTPFEDDGNMNERDERRRKQAPISIPADSGTKSAPVVVLREINAQVSKGYRRLLQHANLDLVELGMIDERVAKELIEV